MAVVIEYLGVKNAYPDLTYKGHVTKLVLGHAAQEKLPEAEKRVARSRAYITKIGHMVRFMQFVFNIPLKSISCQLGLRFTVVT